MHARVYLAPSPSAKSNSVQIAFDDYLIKGPSAKGKRVSNRVARRVLDTTGQVVKEQKKNLTLPGVEEEKREVKEEGRDKE